ncbi:MAG: glyceraldehyde 3-phosphate dehydrogenase NAD-binding domain-containing protein, partial [Desulfitobacterium hafniense]
MSVRIAINGFGRIGRLSMRAILERKSSLDIVAVNDLGSPDLLGHFFKYDSMHDSLPYDVEVKENTLEVLDQKVAFLAEKDPGKLPWRELGVDLV